MNLRFSLFAFGLFLIGGSGADVWAQQPESASPPAAVADKPADAPPQQPAAVNASDPAPAEPAVSEPAASASDTKVEAEAQPATEKSKPGKRKRQAAHQNHAVVNIGSSSMLAAGEKADAVVAILGSSSSAGEVADSVVSILGNTRVTGGSVGDAAVAVLGNLHVNGHVKGDAVAVMGNVDLGPDAVVDGEVVCVGGKVTRHANAVVGGGVENVGLGNGVSFGGLATWFTECVMRGRLLAFDAAVTWAWVIATLFLGFYLLLALVFPAAVNRSVQTLEEQPGFAVLTAVLTLVLTPVVYLLLVFTLLVGMGLLLIPVFSLGLFFAGLFGTAVMLAWLGRRGTTLLGLADAPPVLAVLFGGLVAMLLYATPWVGILVYKLIGILGLGTVIYTLIALAKAKKAAAITVVPAVPVATAMPATAENAASWAAETAGLPPVVSAATLPRAGFWLRLAAAALDVVLVGIVSIVLIGGVPLLLAIYSVAMWATKGTTIGGIICGLKVVRLDDRPVDWSVAVVRGLMAFVSLVVAGLGFIWVAFDDERQSWHDKVAGTTIVRVPKGTALL